MQHLPIFADLAERDCLVVGGGAVAERRVRLLLDAGAAVTVCAPEVSETLARWASDGRVTVLERPFGGLDVEPFWLVVAATDDRATNAAVAAAATAAKRFCNVVDDPSLCSFVTPAIVDRGPVTIAVASGGRSPVLARWIKGLIELAVPIRVGQLATLAGRWRAAVREALPEADRRRRFWQQWVQGPVAEHVLAGRDDAAERAMQATLDAWRHDADEPKRAGEAYLVGAGPGSPDLITIRGRQLLAEADVVLYDRLVNPELLAYARRDAELICVGKVPWKPSITQKQLNRLLVGLVAGGKRVCRLKGGDPLIFGRGGEEIEALVAAGLRFQVVPGVSAAEGCAAYAGIPLTLRGVAHAVLLTTGHAEEHTAAALAEAPVGQTLAFYMGVARYDEIREELLRRGYAPETPVAVVESGTTDRQRVIRTALRSLARAQQALEIRAPALLLVGETTRFAERYAWFQPSKLEIFDEREPALARVTR